MLKKVGFLKNQITELQHYDKSFTNKKPSILSSKKKSQKIPSSKDDDISKICKKNVKFIFSRVKNKNKKIKNTFNSYQYMKQKESKYINKNHNGNVVTKKLSEINKSISPLKECNKNIIFNSSICNNNDKARTKERKRNLSVCENNKTIKEIRIKANKKLSQIFSNSKINNNEDNMITISNINYIQNNKDYHRNKKMFETSRITIYSKKRVNSLHTLSIEKKEKTIQSIEIDFGNTKYGNSFTEKKCLNSFNLKKIIMIQSYFRAFRENKYKKRIINAIGHLKKFIIYHLSSSFNKLLIRSKYKVCDKNKRTRFVKKEQYELLKLLKEKDIISMESLKKYIVRILNRNKLELF